jgi:glucose-1-phosphate thymidylyltransferase
VEADDRHPRRSGRTGAGAANPASKLLPVKGIILAGGAGTRLHPITWAVSKQLLRVYDKPMIYYPLSVLMLAGIRDVLVITTPHQQDQFAGLLGDGSQWGIRIGYAAQPAPEGLAQAFLIGADHIGDDDVALILGDNIFFGQGLSHLLADAVRAVEQDRGCTLFGYRVSDPERYGVAELGPDGRLVDIEEKPAKPRSNIAITGLYLYDNQVVELARTLRPSARRELEITDLNRLYLERGAARLVDLGRGTAWLDTGTHDSLMQAAHFVQVLQQRQGLTIACLEEIAMRQGAITPQQALALAERMGSSSYGEYLHQAAVDFLSAG